MHVSNRALQTFADALRRRPCHLPGEVKPGYVTPWEHTPEWEPAGATTAEKQIRAFVRVGDGTTDRFTREQKGRFVATCWIAQIHRHVPDPKPGCVADWADLPGWQQDTVADVFERIDRNR